MNRCLRYCTLLFSIASGSLLLAAPLPTAPPNRATLIGTITYAETGDPLSNANVIIANSTQSTATVDYKRDVVNPYGVTRSGYYAFKRIADQVPKEYRPR